MPIPKTHFEQISVESVKQIANEYTSEDSISEGLPYPEWQGCYKDALLEMEQRNLKQRIELAEVAIFDRLRNAVQRPLENAELQAIQDAVVFLRALRPS